MEAGEMEARQIDVLWLLTVAAPRKRFQTSGCAVAKAAESVLDSFSVQVDDAL
jgi:hypothetical protein